MAVDITRAEQKRQHYYENHEMELLRYRLQYELSKGRMTRPDRCEKCDRSCKPWGYFDDASTPLADVRWLCRECFRVLRPFRHFIPAPATGDLQRKLPPYEVLRHHLVDEGLSYADIAARYGVGRAGAFRTIKDRAVRRGDWPLPLGDLSARMSRGLVKAKPMLFSRSLTDEVYAVCRDYEISIAEVARRAGVGETYLQEKVRTGSRMAEKQYDKVERTVRRIRAEYTEMRYTERVEEVRAFLRYLKQARILGWSIRGLLEKMAMKDSRELRLFVDGRKRTIRLDQLERLEAGRELFTSSN